MPPLYSTTVSKALRQPLRERYSEKKIFARTSYHVDMVVALEDVEAQAIGYLTNFSADSEYSFNTLSEPQGWLLRTFAGLLMGGTGESARGDPRGCFSRISPHLHNGEDYPEEGQIFRDLWEDETQRRVVIETLKADRVRSGRGDLRAFEMYLESRSVCVGGKRVYPQRDSKLAEATR